MSQEADSLLYSMESRLRNSYLVQIPPMKVPGHVAVDNLTWAVTAFNRKHDYFADVVYSGGELQIVFKPAS